MSALQEIRLKPCRELTVFDVYQIEVAEALNSIRREANFYKKHGSNAGTRGLMSYLYGQLFGVTHAFSTLLIFQSRDFKEADEIRQAALNEAQFLTGPYLAGITGVSA